jgi:glyoxylase-like metal-dependent hydrolase (beta-lactamase superfamily II)
MSAAGAAWSELGDGIHVRQSRAFAMNSVVLLDPEHTVIVDPGVLPSELDDIARMVRGAEPLDVTLFFTHAHWDHVLGRPWWPKAKTLAHDRFADEVRAERAAIAREAEGLAARHGERWERGFAPFTPATAVSGLRFMRLDPWRLVMRDAPGHSASQLTCHLTDHGLLIAADMLSDIEPPILDGPCAPYRETLEALRVLAEHGAIETLIPGHGAIAAGRDAVLERFRTDLDYLAALERGAREAVERGQTLEVAREALAGMDYTGRRSATYPTEAFHRENIRFAFQSVVNPRR